MNIITEFRENIVSTKTRIKMLTKKGTFRETKFIEIKRDGQHKN